MYDQLIERINRGRWQQIAAIFLLWFAVYGSVWTIIEPLGFAFDPDVIKTWRLIYIGSTLLISILIFFLVLFRKNLERFGFQEGDTDLKTTAKISGLATISTRDDGFHGQTYQISTKSEQDYIDWNIKASAHKAKFITFIYKPTPDLYFYARVSVLSRNHQSSKFKWLRFETASSTYQSLRDEEEMGVPVTATDDDGFLRVTVNINKIITTAFGRYGWKYDKILEIRSRCSGMIKSIEVK
jgi:hypothetical protein